MHWQSLSSDLSILIGRAFRRLKRSEAPVRPRYYIKALAARMGFEGAKNVPLVVASIDRVCMHCDFGEKVVEQAQ